MGSYMFLRWYRIGVLLILFRIGISCGQPNAGALTIYQERTSKTSSNKEAANVESDSNFKLTSGIVQLSEDHTMGLPLLLYNKDGSLWKEMHFVDSGLTNIVGLAPFALHPDYFLLAFRCLQKAGNMYEVIVNEETGEVKFINADDPNFVFESWETYLEESVFAVDFSQKNNPLRDLPANAAIKLDYDKDEFYIR